MRQTHLPLRRRQATPSRVSPFGPIRGEAPDIPLPADLAEQVRARVEMRKRFEESAGRIAHLNLRRFLRRKENG